jgi:phosphoglycerol transferase MdoB-like AlkP superfamily enzyme
MPPQDALAVLRQHWLLPQETLLAPDEFPLLRRFDPAPTAKPAPYKNVVVVLMESFSAQRVGVFGNPLQITPNFDALSRDGLLFDHIFSNGTHTHQGMFATFGCFPNLPHYEYLMQQPEGSHHFSGLPKVLSQRNYNNIFVYNGDFAWDNQGGFFRAQGLEHFVGRHDFINPRFSDPTWGVSDEDMFDRAFDEIVKLEAAGKPYYAMLQTLSNHTPYALPEPLPVAKVIVNGDEDQHLTAMRYADYAVGEFFKKIKARGGFDDTLFVLVGDHGFGGLKQLTEMDLVRFHIPLLFIGKDIQTHFGKTRSMTGSQVDVVPTVMGMLGGSYVQHCWGRDLLALPADDPGQAVIKPSGSEQVVALVQGDYILIQPPDAQPRLERFQLIPQLQEEVIEDPQRQSNMKRMLDAYVQTALNALLANRVGHNDELK